MSYIELCKEVGRVAGIDLNTVRDYELLSERVQTTTHVRLSPTTLMRLSGFINEQVTPRRFTLDTLARFAGYHDYDAFTHHHREEQCSPFHTRMLNMEHLHRGDHVMIAWNPNCLCTLEYMGDHVFTVTTSENTRLAAGDTFLCHLIMDHTPLHAFQYQHSENTPPNYKTTKRNLPSQPKYMAS